MKKLLTFGIFTVQRVKIRVQRVKIRSNLTSRKKRQLVFSHKMVFVKNEAALLCVTMRERARAFVATI